MENLLKPDIGLMFWTVVTFLIMVFILKKLAWKPLLQVIDDREAQIRQDMEAAQKNREELEQLKKTYEDQLSQIEIKARALLSDAEQKALLSRETILKEAELQARKLSEKTRHELQVEKEKLSQELRKEVGDLSILMTEKLLKQSVDKKIQERFIQEFLKSLEAPPEKLH